MEMNIDQQRAIALASARLRLQDQAEAPKTSVVGTIADHYKDSGMGALRGAARIGTTLLRPLDATGITGTTNEERKASIEGFFKENSNPESIAFQGGDLGAQIAGTAGVGGVLAKGAQAVGAAPKIVNALQSGGFNLGAPAATTKLGMAGNAALRTGAGAVTGGAMAGLVDPEQAKTGAAIGAALPAGVKVAGTVGSGLKSLAEHVLGTLTGTGSEAVRTAFQAGKTGSKDFLSNMRGESSFDDVVTAAKQGLRSMRAERSNLYRSGMIDIKADKSVLDMTPITKAVDDLTSSGSFKGKVINEKSAGIVKEIADKVDDWAKSNPAEFHTPEGLDALKQAIGDIRDSTQFGTPARRAADQVYNAIKSQIQNQAPTYEKVMKDYSRASETISEIEKVLSQGERGSKDTAIRKLQSLMRNNVNTTYGNRLELARTLEEKGGVSLLPAIAGQSMNTWTPRGLQKLVAGGGVPTMALMGEPVSAGLLAAGSSPRLIGEGLYGLGRFSGAAGNLMGASQGALPGGGGMLSNSMANPAIRALLLNAANP